MPERPLDQCGPLTAIIILSTLEKIGQRPPFKLLDLGTGKGLVVNELREHGIKGFGIDLRERTLPVTGSFVRGNLKQLPFQAASMDVITESLMIAQLKEYDKAAHDIEPILKEMDRVLRPGGFFISNWGTSSLKPHWSYRFMSGEVGRLGYSCMLVQNMVYVFQKP
jgi:ubiquinone/menaquinone biosynthesis C-methylase UbiE